ncbi:MAG: hypothetical protein CNC90_03985 [Cryomorphaceae bacterium MED-G11]|nr:hypothetical protein [Flavobacteriaceae bacterium]PDH52855.1 MAG: hypothetical protein CNC90_03985 [Cryomorphaceae bacterium MED-G11]|tara:strand:- start:269 stop:937 length:669 start_codon:yes stop_codon:yes gene_type:complete
MLIGQTESNSNDTLIKKDKLLKINKIRLGFDLLKPVLSSSEGDNLNYEIVGDLQLTENIYLAGEYGLVDKVIEDENINFNSTGSFLRIGFDYNMFENWIGMDNSIYIGLRYGTSNFSSKILDYNVRNKDSYFSNLVTNEFQTIEYSNLSGNWIELLLGIKVETFKNVYLGLSLRLNKLLSDKKPDNFGNLFIPGFNKVTDENTFGSGFNYTLTYSIPLKKRK